MSFNYKLNVGKDVSDIVSNICGPVDETDVVFVGEVLELCSYNLLLLLLLGWCSLLYVLSWSDYMVHVSLS